MSVDKFWSEEGKVDYEYRWKDGLREGLHTEYSKSGLIIYKQFKDRNHDICIDHG